MVAIVLKTNHPILKEVVVSDFRPFADRMSFLRRLHSHCSTYRFFGTEKLQPREIVQSLIVNPWTETIGRTSLNYCTRIHMYGSSIHINDLNWGCIIKSLIKVTFLSQNTLITIQTISHGSEIIWFISNGMDCIFINAMNFISHGIITM